MTERDEEQAALNAVHALDPHERQIFQAEMRTDPRLRDLVVEFENAAAQVALLLPREAPPEDVKPMLLKTLKQRRRAKASPAEAAVRFLLGPRIAWAAAVCLAVIAWSGRSTIRQLSERITALSRDESKVRGELAVARDAAAVLKKDLADARGRADRLSGEVNALKQASTLARMEVVILRTVLRRYGESSVVIVWDGGKQEGRLRVERMPPVPANKVYQLWIIDGKSSAPVSTGPIKLDAHGGATKPFKLGETAPGAVKFAISIETAGGAPRKPAEGLIIFAGP